MSIHHSGRQRRTSSHLCLESLETRRLLTVFTVTTTADSGAGSLRSAITQLNADESTGIDTINFDIAPGGLQVIAPLTPLPTISHPVVIDGTTQSRGSATPPIQLYGGLLTSNPSIHATGLAISADDSTVEGLVIDGFGNSSSYGYGIDLSGKDDSLVGCFIGTNAAGTAAVPNEVGVIGGATVGGTTAADRNLISGNGIGIEGNDNDLTPLPSLIEGNDIGTDVTGLKAVPNLIGVEAVGNDTIGGTTSGMGNLISGNSGDGIYCNGNENLILIEGNSIGIAADGSPLGNAQEGVLVTFVSVVDDSPFPDYGASGVDVIIGGTVAGAGNVIANNGSDGVNLESASIDGSLYGPNGVDIQGNSIYDNGGIGIDFNGEGSLPNLPLDSIAGPNSFQNHPVLTSATISGGMATISGTFVGTPGTSYQFDFFANDTPGDPGISEGQYYLGSATGITTSTGLLTFSDVVPDASGLGNFTATATDQGAETSQLSPTLIIGQSPPVSSLLIVASPSPSTITSGQSSTITDTITNQGPDTAYNVQAVVATTASVDQGSLTSITVGTSTYTDDSLPIPIGNLAAGQSATLTVVYSQQYNNPGTITETTQIFGLYPNSNAANNGATATITVAPLPAPVLSVSQVYSRPTVRAGDPITFTVTVTNTGDAVATTSGVTDLAPSNITSVSSSQGTTSVSENRISAGFGTLGVGDSATLTFTITPPTTTSIVNNATPSDVYTGDGSTVTLPASYPSTLPTDYFGPGESDLAIYLPAYASFAIRPQSGPDVIVPFGFAGEGLTLPAPGDYDGDGKADIAAYLPSLGAFAIRPSSGGPDEIIPFGLAGAGQSIPMPGDYDGSGKTELAVYLPSLGIFAYRPANGGPDVLESFGIAGAGQSIPAPGDYDGDGKADLAIYLPSIGAFAIRPSSGGPDEIIPFGLAGAGQSIPMPGDYDGSGKTELAVYLPSVGVFAYRPADGGPDVLESFGVAGPGQTIPVTATESEATVQAASATVSAEDVGASNGEAETTPTREILAASLPQESAARTFRASAPSSSMSGRKALLSINQELSKDKFLS